MPISRILILAGASFAFLLMITSVTSSSEFVYAPESTWKTVNDREQDVAVAAWRSQQSASVPTKMVPTAQVVATEDSGDDASSSSVAAAPDPASSSSSSVEAVESSSSSAADSPWWEDVIPDWGDDRDDDDGDRGDRNRRDKDRKGRD